MLTNLVLHVQLREMLTLISKQSCVDIGLNDDLFAAGILDSFGIIAFVIQLEEQFHCAIPQDLLIPQNFLSIHAIADNLNRLGVSTIPRS